MADDSWRGWTRRDLVTTVGAGALAATVPRPARARVARGDDTPEAAVAAAEKEYQRIFARWK